MTVRNRGGFTLVELLVVITIIGMLVALLVPAVISAREAARRAQCINNQSELSKALQQYEMAKQHFPGYVNRFGTQTGLSWVVVSLPYLGREDLWKPWRDGSGVRVRIAQLFCPSDSPPISEDGPTSYVANCGRPGVDPSPSPQAYGVFHDHTVAQPTLVSAANIPDGTQMTLLISENIQGNQWYMTTEPAVGMVWHDAPTGSDRCEEINRCLDRGPTTTSTRLARPSCYHSGGAVVSFCDGRQYFLRDDIDYNVYKHLTTPDSNAAGIPGTPDEGMF